MKRLCGKRTIAALMCACALALLLPAPPARAAAFSDVPAGHWAGAEIAQCVERGLFRGESETFFGAAHPMTRAAFAVVTSRFFGWESGGDAYPVFSDVRAGEWYEPALRACFEHGAIPREETAFRPNDPVTRGEMAAILVRALGYGVVAQFAEHTIPFTDVNAGRGYVAAAYALGIFRGVSATEFAPERTASRAQVAVVFSRLYEKLRGEQCKTAVLRDRGDAAPEGAEIAVFPVLTMHGSRPIFSERENAKNRAQAVRKAGGTALLQIAATEAVFSAGSADVAAAATDAAEADGYDGILLNVTPARDTKKLAALASAIRAAAPEMRLYAVVDVPNGGAIDVSALAKACDVLIARVPAFESTDGTLPVAANDPPEAVYAALAALRGQTERFALWVTAERTAFREGRRAYLSDTAFRAVWNTGERYYSERYACAYVQSGAHTVWYLSERALNLRRQLASMLGAEAVFLSSAAGAESE